MASGVGNIGHDVGGHDVVHSDFGVNRSPSSKKTILPTDCLIVAIAKMIWNFIKDFQNMMFIAEIDWALKKVIALVDIFNWGDFLFALPFLNIALTPIIVPHLSKTVYDRFKMAYVAASVNRMGKLLYYGALGIGTVSTTLGCVTSSIRAIITLCGSQASKLLFGAILPPVLLAMTSFAAIFKTWKLGRNLYDYVQYHKVLSEADTDKGLKALYDRVIGPKKVVELTSSATLDTAAKKAEKVYKLARAGFKDSHISDDSRHKEVKAILYDTERMEECQRIRDDLLCMKGAVAQQDLIFPISSILYELENLKALIDEGDIWGALVKEIEIYETIIIPKKEELRAYLKDSSPALGYSDVDALFEKFAESKGTLEQMLLTYKGFVREKGAEVADALCSEMHRAILNNALAVLMAGLIISSSLLAIVAPDLVLLSIGLGLACGTIDMAFIIFDKAVSRKAFRKIDFLASLSRRLHKYPTVDPKNMVAATT